MEPFQGRHSDTKAITLHSCELHVPVVNMIVLTYGLFVCPTCLTRAPFLRGSRGSSQNCRSSCVLFRSTFSSNFCLNLHGIGEAIWKPRFFRKWPPANITACSRGRSEIRQGDPEARDSRRG